jgi:AraC-like DNA-binding protein
LISEEYHRPLRLADMARAAVTSPSHFARRFKADPGISARRYLRKLRLDAACELLSTTDLTISEIAARVGYYDQSHLTRDFTRRERMTPTQYRGGMHSRSPAVRPSNRARRVRKLDRSTERWSR